MAVQAAGAARLCQREQAAASADPAGKLTAQDAATPRRSAAQVGRKNGLAESVADAGGAGHSAANSGRYNHPEPCLPERIIRLIFNNEPSGNQLLL